MRTIRSILALAAIGASLTSGSGCTGRGFWKHKDTWEVPEMTTPLPGSAPYAKPDSGVVQAGGTSPFAQIPATIARMTGKSEKIKLGTGATEIGVAWRNHIDLLPDPIRQGAMAPGLAGQVFLVNQHGMPSMADGTITIELQDMTQRPAGQPSIKPERWQFKKDTLKTLVDVDERFGPYYGVFLPWPTYRPDITHVRITVRYDPANGDFPLYAPESKLVLDNSLKGGPIPIPAFEPGAVIPAGGTDTVSGAPAEGTGPGMGMIRIGRRPVTDESPAALGPTNGMPNPPAIGTIHPPNRP